MIQSNIAHYAVLRTLRVSGYIGLTISVLLIVSAVQSNVEFTRKVDSFHIFPGAVESQGWVNTNAVFIQDVSEDALYQDFNTTNSATLAAAETTNTGTGSRINEPSMPAPGDTSPTDQPATDTQRSTTSTTTTSNAPTDTTTPTTSETDTSVDDDASTTAPTDDVVEGTGTSDDEDDNSSSPEPMTPEPTEESSDAESSDPDSTTTAQHTPGDEGFLGGVTRSLSTLFTRVTGSFRFAAESTSTPLSVEAEEEEQTIEGSATEAAGESSETETEETQQRTTSTETSTETEETAETFETTITEDTQVNTTTTPTSTDETTTEDTQATTTDEAPTTPAVTSSDSTPVDTSNEQKQGATSSLMTFTDFAIPSLGSGQFITNVQLRMSFAAQHIDVASTSNPTLAVEYRLDGAWQNAGSIKLDEETSNAVNGGYYLFALPTLTDTKAFRELEVRVRYQSDGAEADGVYLESVWLEVDTESFDRTILRDRINSIANEQLKRPDVHELINQQRDFTRGENPYFTLRYKSQRNVAVRFMREVFGRDLANVESLKFMHRNTGELKLTPEIDITPEGLFTIQLSDDDRARMRPGQYTVELTIAEGGKTFTDSFDFQWGMLAINPDQTEYERGATSTISMGALTPNGNTLCSANLKLYIIDPDEFISVVPVERSGACDGNNVTDVPDYQAKFVPETSGTYEMYLERIDDAGKVISHTSDTFKVVDTHPADVVRNGPTRIYPPSPYPMEITVRANESFSGTLTERVPGNFDILETDAVVTRTEAGHYELSWDFSLLADDSKTFSYRFDAPDLSPFLYELGPAALSSSDLTRSTAFTLGTTSPNATTTIDDTSGDSYDFVEHREWQIASDATGNMILFWDDGTSIPTGWTCISCGSGTFYQRFAVGSSTYNNTGGTTQHNHSVSSSLLTSSDAAVESGSGGPAIVTHNHTFNPSISTESNLPAYRQLRVIQYTDSAGEPPTIPAGAIGIFDVASSSLPSGWNRYAAQDGYYVYGEDAPGTTGGSNVHTHDITGSTGGSTGGTARSRGGGTQETAATDGHTHTFSATTPQQSNEPPHVEVLLGKLSAESAPPTNLIAMWTDEVPTGWLDVSSNSGDAFHNKFMKASTTYSDGGGAQTHSHPDMNGEQTSGPSATTNGRSGTSGAGPNHAHDINLTNFSTVDHLPPYVSVVIGKRQGTDPIFNQRSYRWYGNENAEPPTDPWPLGATDLAEREPITATSTPVNDGDVLRLRMNAQVTNATSSAGARFKLQYASTTSSCSAATVWHDVGAATSSEEWRGYDNTGLSDHGTISSQVLASSTVSLTYEENGYATGTPNEIGVGGVGEWDFVLEQNGASPGATYCFRVVENDGTEFFTYTSYPQLLTNGAPDAPELFSLFDNEKTASTTPWFEFVASDPESQDVDYQIQVDNNYAFTSTVIDKNTISNSAQFENLVTTSDKNPYKSGERIRFTSQTVLSNGTTYYWRVRARDSDGSNSWGDWSTIRSFTIDTSLSAAAWFQTEDEQFDTNVLSGVGSTGSDSVDMSGAVPDVSILNGFTTGNTKSISSGSNRLLVVGIHSEDSSTNVDIDTVTYGGQTLTEVRDEQITTTFSNGMWVGYLDESGIQAASGNTITPTWNGGTPDTAVLYSSVVFENVDQSDPVPDWSANSDSSVSTIQPTSTTAVSDGDHSVYFTVSGSGGQTHTPASGYTEGTEQDSESVAANAYKAITANGTEQPTADWTNPQNRLAIVALTVSKATEGSMFSTPIKFADGEQGTAWGSFSWNDTETSGDIKYQVEYLTDSATWELVPDSALSGNSTGFDTSPVNLLVLDVDTYDTLRLVANFTDVGGSPSLEDWTVNWGYRIETPTITKLFPNEKTGTTQPTFEFTTTDPQSDPLTYQVQWSTDYDFTASTTRTSSSSAGFVNIDNAGDTDPFTSGDTIQYTVQPADALTNGATYWWRVRATDPTGADAFSFWTQKRSFTVATDTAVSTWFQTTQEQFDTNILSGTKALASDEVAVATTATEAMLIYGEGTDNTPRYRQWNGSSWGSEGLMQGIEAPTRWAVVRAGTTREEYVAGTLGTDGDVNVQVFSSGEWGNLQELTANAGDVSARGFDIAYETLSGNAIVAYCDNNPDPNFSIWDGNSWTSGGTINLATTNECAWIRLASDPTSDEIVLLSLDSDGSQYEAQVWDGTTWGNSTVQGSMTSAGNEGMDVIYEESGDQAIIVTSDGNAPKMTYDTWDGTTWSGATALNIGNEIEWGQLTRDVGSDAANICYVDADIDIGVYRWTGSAWTGQTELDVDGNSDTDRPVACMYETTSGRDGYIMTAYSDTAATNYSFWNGTTWSTETQINSIGNSATMQLERTGDGTILGLFFDHPNDSLRSANWDGTSWSTTVTLENDMSVSVAPFGHPYFMAPRNSNKSGTTIVSPGIDFDDGVGPYWQRMSWVDTTPGSSDILYSVQYYDTASSSWKFIPDSDIPGNSTGTSTGPIDLSELDINTYDRIRPYASLSCDGSDNCPTLQDWTVEWAEGITVSGTLQQSDQSTNVESGTVAVAVNGVLQTGKTGTVSGGSWSIPNVTVFAGDIITVFVNDATSSAEAVGVTRYDGSGNITGMDMYEEHLSLGSDDATTTPLTNADIGQYDVDNDEDVFFDLTGTTFTLCGDSGCDNAALFVQPGTIYQPGGTLYTHDIEINGTFRPNGNTIYVSGSWDNNATTTMATSTVVFTATSTSESIDSTGATVSAFNNVIFGSSTSAADWSLVAPFDVNGNLSVNEGILNRGNESITIAGNLSTGANGSWSGIGTTTFDGGGTSNWSDAHVIPENVGHVVVDGASKNVTLSSNVAAQSITVGANDILDASPSHYNITVYGDWVNNNTFVARQGAVLFTATTSNKIITTGGNAFHDLTFNGVGGSWSFTENDLAVNNDLTIATGTLTMPTGTTTLGGSFDSVGGTFMHNNAAILLTSSAIETIAASGTPFTNNFYTLDFNGSGSWSFLDQHATTSSDLRIQQGSVTLPSGTFAVGGSFANTAGTFAHNNGILKFTSTGAESIDANASFNDLRFTGSGSWSFADTNATALGDLTVDAGTLTLPSGTLTLGGSLANAAAITHNSGEILFNSSDAGETIDLGGSSLYDATFNNETGGWTITGHATATNDFTLATSSNFTLATGQTLSVGGVFTNSVGGASTTWSGSTLSLEAGTYSINKKSTAGDVYEALRVASDADIAMWNSSATTYDIDATGSLYSQDHGATDGELYIFGDYTRASGTEYWSYDTDFDGTDLSGGSERQAQIFIAAGGAVSLSSSTLSVVGSSTASTTIQNQGAGAYTVNVSGGTTTAAYYDFSDLGTTGVSLLASTTVTSLSDGAFTPAASGGTALTLSRTTIDTNPQKQIFRVDFSTTTAISATNVSQTDGTPSSYWWFRNSSGNIDGEAFDNDTGDPGSVRWDDSSLVVTISGTVYSDDESTPLGSPTCGTGDPVRIVVEGGSTYDGACNSGDGSFSIGGVVVVGDPTVTVFLNDAAGGERAVTVTKTPTEDITDLDLYENRVVTRHEDTDPLTIADMAAYDSSDDPDIPFIAATGTTDTLVLERNTELHIGASSTFTPGGTVTLNADATGNTYDGSLHLGADATFTGAGTTTYTIGGSVTLESGATFVPASSTIVMTATTTGKTITTQGDETLTLNELRFTGIGGGWNINGNINTTGDIQVATGTVTGTGDITLAGGSFYGNGLVSLGAGTTTVYRTNTLGGTQGWTFNDLTLGNGAVAGTTTPGSTATTTINGRLTIETAHFLDAGTSSFDLRGTGTVFVENGTFLEDTSRVRYSGTGDANILSTDYYDLSLDAFAGSPTYTATGLGIQVLNDLNIGNSATTVVDFNANDTALNVDGDMYIGSTGTFEASDSGSFTVAGSYENNGTFTANSGLLTFDGSGTHSIAAGDSSFSSVSIDGSGDFTIIEHATATDALTLTNATLFSVDSNIALAVGGTFTNGIGGGTTDWTGSTLYLYGGGNYEINASTTNEQYEVLRIGENTDIRMWNSDAVTFTIAPSGSLYSQDHNEIDGHLFIYGEYVKTSGIDHWSYDTDFDGTDLSGGSERAATVFIEADATTTYSGGALSVLGDAAASTTIRNQGSGTYALRIGGNSSTTWSYYEVRDTNASGLVFSGSPTVADISNGNFIVSQADGSAITVGGTVIDQNPAKTFTQNIFATTSPISAFNVTATGTSVSSWRFTNHAGNIAGEAFDNDPDGDPGYIVWDDSAANITISGNVYSDEGSTASGVCDGATNNVHLRVAGLTSYTASCDGSTGAYSISGVTYSPGDSLVLYIDGESVNAATVTTDPVSNINNADLYEDRVIVRHENTDPITITDLSVWDSSDDADIPFTAAGSLVLPADTKLIVWGNKTFEPGGDVTVSGGGAGADHDGTLELYSGASFIAEAGETHTIGGSFISGNGATFESGTSAVIFTTSGAGRTIDTNTDGFHDVTFDGSGSWTITNTELVVAGDVTLSSGDVTFPAGTTTVSGSFENTGGSFDMTNGQIIFDSNAAETVRPGGSSFGTTTFSGTGSWSYNGGYATSTGDFTVLSGAVVASTGTLAVGGDVVVDSAASFSHNGGTLRLYGSAPDGVLTLGGEDLYGLTFAGAGTTTMTDASLAVLDDLSIANGTVVFASNTLSIAGSFQNDGVFDHASGTVLFNAGSVGKTIDPGESSFYNVNFSSGAGGWTLPANATATNNFSLTNASSFTLDPGNTLTVGGVFTNTVGGAATTWSDTTLKIQSGVGYTVNTKSSGGDQYGTLVVAEGTDLRVWNSAAATTSVGPSSSLYSQDHNAVDGELYVYGDYRRTIGTDHWSYATDFDGTDLSGGSERAVTVFMADAATTTFIGGTLKIIGASGFETTVQNQDAGTYAMDILGGSIQASNYAFRDLDGDGLNLAGTTTVTSLSDGDFELAVDGGSLITLSSTTLNYNASKVIQNVRFATTTAITGTNVNLVGTTPSAWTFTTHTGNLAGEAFDVDGGSQCGSLRWDDSSCLITEQAGYRWRSNDGGEGVPDSEWFDTDWSKRKRVTITNNDGTAYTDAVVKLNVTYDTDMQSSFNDLRFADSSGTTTLDHFIGTTTPSTDAVVWVKVPSLAAAADTTIYMYYGNGAVSDASNGANTFIAFDNFEDGNLSEYSGDTGEFVVASGDAYERTYRLEANDPDNGRTQSGGMYDNANTVSQGETLRYLQYIDTASGSGDESCTLFGTQSQTENYAVCLELFGTDRISLAQDVLDNDTSGTVLASSTVSYSTGWYEVEIDWGTDNSIFVSLYKDDSLVATTSATDGTYTSGGIGYSLWFYHGGWDSYTSRPLLTSDPEVTFGGEQVSGGASWLASLNSSVTGVEVGDIVRPRFLVENSGLSVTDQYRLEYAEKGSAPSCESIAAASYVAVPPQSSCSGSALCMQSSTQFTNKAATTDLLGGDGTFTAGQIIKDPSNDTDSITVGSEEYTELEYAIEATNDVTDSNYCLRVTDAGTALDSYTQVAELELLFTPNITALSLNNGLDISLTGGGTTTVFATGTVSDLNGYQDLDIATSTVFRNGPSGVSESCTPDDNNCYRVTTPQCSFTNCSGNSCDVQCSIDLYYFADPTDSGTFAGDAWTALLSVSDQGGAIATATSPSVDLLTLRAISVDSEIDYGTLSVNDDTGSYNATTSVENIGNDNLDISIEGTDLSDGSSSVIPADRQRFATSTFTYSSCVICSTLSTSTTDLELDLVKPTSTAPAVVDQVFWGISVPFGVAGTPHQGSNIFYAIGD